MPDDRNDNNSQTPREPKIPGMPGGKKPTRTGWLYFLLACALLGYAFFNMGSGFASSSNTVKLATSEMVTRLGMSEELGTQVFGEAQHQVFLGRDYADHQDYSEETARRIDIEVQRIMREAHRRAVEILDARRDQLDLMAKVLLERETVEGDAVNALLDNEWDAYLEREGDILAAKEERNAKAAGMPTKKRAPRMSEEELAADAAAFAQAAMQEDAEVASDDAGDDHAVNADADTDK